MLLTEKGLNIHAFEPTLASLLGSDEGDLGGKILGEAGAHQRRRVEVRDWFYLLLKSPAKNAVRAEFDDSLGLNVARFVEDIESSYDADEASLGMPPSDLVPSAVAPEVLSMLEHADKLRRDHGCPDVSDLELTLAILVSGDETLHTVLEATLDPDRFDRLKKSVLRKIKERGGPAVIPADKEIFDADGKLRFDLFSITGQQALKRWREDVAAIGIKTKLTTRHLMYSILGNASGPLPVALSTYGFAAKDLHAILARELTRAGRKRNDEIQLHRDSLFAAVVCVLKHAQTLAQEREAAGIGEIDIHRAMLAKDPRELVRLLAKPEDLSLATLSEHLAETQEEEEEPTPLQRYTLQEMKDRINATIYGQESAVDRIAPWISRFRFGLPRGNRPAGVFLFLGPTGTGKTQLGKELARYVYGNEEEMLFIEMGQFKTKESMNMFIGSPPGYVGYGEGKLTNGLRDHPECVVLFDEIEKADTSVFDTLLRFADEGKISDPAGPVRDGRKCIIVMTTNAGQKWLREHVKEHPQARDNPESLADQLYRAAEEELAKAGYRPEFLGRVDERITFLPFSLPTCREIIDGVLKKELAVIKDLKGVTVDVPEEIRNVLAQFAFGKAMDEGARGAPRAVNQFIISPLIDLLSPFEERGEKLPRTVRGMLFGTPGDHEGAKIEWEVEP